MILKKPYAFLVKHFKLIHTILLVVSIYLVVKMFSLCGFLSKYIDNDLRIIGTADVTSYVSNIMIISTIVIVVASGIIIYLMRYKKKPILFYLYTIILNTVLLIGLLYMSNFLYDIQFNAPNLRFASIIKDIYYTVTIAEAPVILFSFFRAIGFDVKKFDFKKDLLDLGIDEKDNEEYEVELNLDTEDIKAKVRKRFRFFKYFYKENKVLFVIAGGVLAVVLIAFISVKWLNSEKIYKENQFFEMNSYKVKVLDSYKVKTDALGNTINGKNFYVILKLKYVNKLNNSYFLNTNNIRLGYSDYDSTTPITTYNERLKEFGTNYYSQVIYGNEERDFVFIYEVPNEYYNSEFMLKYLYDITQEKDEIKYKYKKVKLDVEEFKKEKQQMAVKSIGEELSFEGSLLGNTTIKINDYQIKNIFYYNVISCKNGSCMENKSAIQPTMNNTYDLSLMRLDYNINYDRNMLGKNYYNDNFISQYGTIRFEIDGKIYNNNLILNNKTPYVTNQYDFLEVRSVVARADKIYLDFNIRDKVYTYILKDKDKEVPESETEANEKEE